MILGSTNREKFKLILPSSSKVTKGLSAGRKGVLLIPSNPHTLEARMATTTNFNNLMKLASRERVLGLRSFFHVTPSA
jgi:hypothetical protein